MSKAKVHCAPCDRQINTPEGVRIHFTSFQHGGESKCEGCLQIAPNDAGAFILHVMSQEHPLYCNDCSGASFKTKADLLMHEDLCPGHATIATTSPIHETSPEDIGLFVMNVSSEEAVRDLFSDDTDKKNIVKIEKHGISNRVVYFKTTEDRDAAMSHLSEEWKFRTKEDRSRPLVKNFEPRPRKLVDKDRGRGRSNQLGTSRAGYNKAGERFKTKPDIESYPETETSPDTVEWIQRFRHGLGSRPDPPKAPANTSQAYSATVPAMNATSQGFNWLKTNIFEEEEEEVLQRLSKQCLSVGDFLRNKYCVATYTAERLDEGLRCQNCASKKTSLRMPGTTELSAAPCCFHIENKKGKKNAKFFPCCGANADSKGCTTNPVHVFASSDRDARYSTFALTPPAQSFTPKYKAVVIDCEMAGGVRGTNELILICAVDFLTGKILLKKYVMPMKIHIKDWRTGVHGITRQDVIAARNRSEALVGWEAARQELWNIIDADTILIGHSLKNDLDVLRIIHNRVVDSCIIVQNAIDVGVRSYGLPYLFKEFLHVEMRDNKQQTHDCVEDVYATREVVLFCLRKGKEFQEWAAVKKVEEIKKKDDREEEVAVRRQEREDKKKWDLYQQNRLQHGGKPMEDIFRAHGGMQEAVEKPNPKVKLPAPVNYENLKGADYPKFGIGQNKENRSPVQYGKPKPVMEQSKETCPAYEKPKPVVVVEQSKENRPYEKPKPVMEHSKETRPSYEKPKPVVEQSETRPASMYWW